MEPINNARFGQFVAERRLALGFTQKELGAQLFVSDKTVSKWERGESLPNIALLQPLAAVLGVSVTELLNGAHNEAPSSPVHNSTDDFSLSDALRQVRQRWLALFLAACVAVLAETLLFKVLAFPLSNGAMLLSALCLLFAAWLCLFAKPLLPGYYDENKINFVQQGPFRINMVGLHFNNNNWPHILTLLRCLTLLLAVLAPLASLLLTPVPPMALLFILLILVFVPLYIIGKKYE